MVSAGSGVGSGNQLLLKRIRKPLERNVFQVQSFKDRIFILKAIIVNTEQLYGKPLLSNIKHANERVVTLLSFDLILDFRDSFAQRVKRVRTQSSNTHNLR